MNKTKWIALGILGLGFLVGVGLSEWSPFEVEDPLKDIEVTKNGREDIPKVGWNILRDLDFETGFIGSQLKPYKDEIVQVPGFVVPLSDGAMDVDEFLLVPNAMACIHVPPPPPNQIVYVRLKDRVPIHKLLRPVWVLGRLEIIETKSEYGSAGFEMKAMDIEEYKR